MPRKAKPTAPGSPLDTEAMIRVDHAGEYGAVRIYQGQLAVLKRRKGAQHSIETIAQSGAAGTEPGVDAVSTAGSAASLGTGSHSPSSARATHPAAPLQNLPWPAVRGFVATLTIPQILPA